MLSRLMRGLVREWRCRSWHGNDLRLRHTRRRLPWWGHRTWDSHQRQAFFSRASRLHRGHRAARASGKDPFRLDAIGSSWLRRSCRRSCARLKDELDWPCVLATRHATLIAPETKSIERVDEHLTLTDCGCTTATSSIMNDSSEVRNGTGRQSGSSAFALIGLGVSVVVVLVLGVLFGSDEASLFKALREPSMDRTILFTYRLPRVALAAIAGGGLAVVGAAFQALLRNPLAEPYVLGVSGGAAFGATVVIGVGVSTTSMLGALLLPLSAWAGGMLATFSSTRLLEGSSWFGWRASCSRV